jgi:hypothetical protein
MLRIKVTSAGLALAVHGRDHPAARPGLSPDGDVAYLITPPA